MEDSKNNLERDSARFQWVERNFHVGGTYIDHFDQNAPKPGYFIVIDDAHGEERYQTFGEAVDAAIAREKSDARDERKLFEWWAINNQPWLLERPKDDAHKLLILTAWEAWQAAISAQRQDSNQSGISRLMPQAK